MNEIFCTQCGHDPLLQADNDRRNREELEAAKAEIEYIRAMNLTLSNQLGEARARIAELEERIDVAEGMSYKRSLRIAELETDDELNRKLIESITKQFDKARAEIAALKGFQASTPKSVDFIVFMDGDGAEPEATE
jgi:chromosome segregation ATPase